MNTKNTNESLYWIQRNVLVDAAKEIGQRAPSCIREPDAFIAWLASKDGVAYGSAIAALRAFDAAHGGTPIL